MLSGLESLQGDNQVCMENYVPRGVEARQEAPGGTLRLTPLTLPLSSSHPHRVGAFIASPYR